MLKDTARSFYFDNYNCAESVFLAADRYYGLGVDPSDARMVGGFGGGIQTGSTCGAFLSGVCVLSLLCVEDRAHESPSLREAVSSYTSRFTQRMSGALCGEIRPRVFDGESRCVVTVDAACDSLEETVSEMKLR